MKKQRLLCEREGEESESEGGVRQVELCGHATLATAHAVLSARPAAGRVLFRTLSGTLEVRPPHRAITNPARPGPARHARPDPPAIGDRTDFIVRAMLIV